MFKIIAVAFILLVPLNWIYVVDKAKCNGCGACLYSCPQGAISMVGPDAYIDPELCDGCGTCVNYCPRNAIFKEWYNGIEEEENTNTEISFSRNPVIGGSVTVNGIAPLSEVIVLNLSGRVVIRRDADDQGILQLDLSPFPEGAYLVVAENDIAMFTSI